ncbi:hypothetical protein GQ600_2382 [Phytophthora cactorum]|nr:hypothetical protein GQ600_2382 [Phytophthora cactorum]
MTRGRVLRLTDGTSSMLCGWHGVSILFAAPDTPRMSNYAKIESFKYIMPAWSLEELQDYNSLLSDKLELPDDIQEIWWNSRYIFTWTERGNVEEQRRAIASCNAQDMISYVSRKLPVPVNSRDHSDSILVMVPSEIPSGGCVQVQMISGRHIPRYDIRRHQELPM